MDKERNRRFSKEQMKLSTASTTRLTISKRDQSPNNLLSVDRLFCLQERSNDKGNDDKQTTEGLKKDLLNEEVEVDVNRTGFLDGGFNTKKVSGGTRHHARSSSGAFFVKRSDQSPRNDIGLSVKRHRPPRERSLSKQSQFSSNLSGRQMSSPGNFFNNSSSEKNSASTRIVTASERKTNRLITQVEHPFDDKKESRDVLPIITKSLETLKTEDHSKRRKSSEPYERNDGLKTSKWSPRSFSSDTSTERIQGLLESKITPESRVVTPQTSRTEGNSGLKDMASKNKIIVQFSRPDGKQQSNIASRPFTDFQIHSGDSSSWKTKVRESKQSDLRIDLGHPCGSKEEFKAATTGEGKKRQTQRQKVTMNTQMRVDCRPKSKSSSRNDGTAAYNEPHSATNPEHELVDLKVKAFLQRHQPKASHGTLKVKAAKKKPVFPANKLRERRSQDRIIFNTDSCPSSNLVNQDRSWYYQDRKGKCRYLRLPESPVPPIEWVFKRSSSP